MNVREFLAKLQFFFPLERKKEDIPIILEGYVNDILFEINKSKWRGYDCDFEILLKTVRSKHQYKELPSVSTILKSVPEAMVKSKIAISYSGREGEVIKRTINGVEYEFTVVPNHWEKVRTISELDREIEERTKKEIA